jgi:hypothetical protein
MAQQTAVDFLIKEFSDILGPLDTIPMQDLLLMAAIKQSKEMFQQQIEAAWKRGDGEHDKVADELSKKYYNETFGK